MNKTRWIIFGAIVIAIFALAIVNTSQSSKVAFEGDATKVITDGPIQDYVYGSEEQKVVLIEYADYQCPACASMNPLINKIKEDYKEHLTFIFREMPLTSIHPNALAASTAAEAAGLQGKYYEMHDALYESQSVWSSVSVKERTEVFEGLAESVGLDIDKYREDLNNEDIKKKIERDRTTGDQIGVSYTPSFVLNGELLDEVTATDPDKLRAAVEKALVEAGFDINL